MDPLQIELPMPLATPRLLLRPVREDDAAALHAAVCDSIAELQPWLPWAQRAPTPGESLAVCRRMQGRFLLRDDLALLVFERRADGGEGALVGGTGLHRIDWVLRRFEIGYWRRSGCGRRGLATEAVGALARYAFDTLLARRLEIRCDVRNAASRRVAERAGFTLEGVLRSDSVDVLGASRDTCVYARVRDQASPLTPRPD